MLLDENSLLAKLNLKHEQRHREMLDERMKLEDEQQAIVKELENQINNLQLKLNENDSGNVQIIEDKNLENEKLKNELKVSQDFLRIASDKNSELQVLIVCLNIGVIHLVHTQNFPKLIFPTP